MSLGRNEPCHCGSGKKYKKCCLEKDRRAEQEVNASNGKVIPFPGGKTVLNQSQSMVNALNYFINEELEWQDETYRLLAQELFPRLWNDYYPLGQVDELEHLKGFVLIWNAFTSEEQPKYRKPGGYAGALEYFIAFSRGRAVTQVELADKHEVSAGTLSRCYTNLMDFAEEALFSGDGFVEEDSMPDMGGLMAFSEREHERYIQQLAKLIEEQQFESVDEAEAFLNQHRDQLDERVEAELAKAKFTDEAKADALLEQAEQEPVAARRMRLIKEAIRLDKGNGDAYAMLALEMKAPSEAMQVVAEGLQEVVASLGPDYFEENKGHFWGLLETRPYMRLKYFYADLLKEQGDLAAATKELEEMLELCPNDNMGVRYELLMLYLADHKLDRAAKLLQEYDEGSASFCYDRLVLSYLEHGITKELDDLYKQAFMSNRYVPDFLLGKKRLPKQRPQFIGIGDADEAVEYVWSHKLLWSKRNLSALKDWMKRIR